MEQNSIIEGISIGMGGIIGYFAGLNYKIFMVLLILMALDTIVGVIGAIMNDDFSSSEMKYGIMVKLLIIIMLLSLTLLQIVLEDYGINAPFGNVITGILCFMETFSILETLSENGVIVPAFVMKWFRITQEKIDDIE